MRLSPVLTQTKPCRALRGMVFLAACLLAPVALTACTAGILANGAFSGDRPHLNLTEASYRAADMLAQQSQAFVTRDTTLTLGPIADIRNPSMVTPLGRTLGNQVAARFVQLGYHVSGASYDEMNGGVPPGMTPGVLNPPSGGAYGGGYGGTGQQAAQATLTGQYAVADSDVLVNLRLIDVAQGRVLAAYDYSLPLSRDIKELARLDGERKSFFDF